MRSLSLLCVVALTAIRVDGARADETGAAVAPTPVAEAAAAAPSATPGGAVGEDPLAEFAGAEAAAPSPEPAGAAAAPVGTDEAAIATEQTASEAPVPAMTETKPASAAANARRTRSHNVVLGPLGVDGSGHQGRVHTVARGDTLWDISNAYLGTPWVWPSIWHDNDTSIENPHLIHPGEMIWITSNEMRRVTREEADELIGGVPPETADTEPEPVVEESVPTEEPQPGPAAVAGMPVVIDLPADIDSGSLSVPASAGAFTPAQATLHVPARDTISFVSSETIEAATSIVDDRVGRTWLAEGDTVNIGIGEGAVEVGNQFTVFRDEEPVRDMRGRLLGYHVQVLGWLEVKSVHPESATAEVRVSVGEMKVGDRLVPREVLPSEVALHPAPPDFEGHVVHFPNFRTVAADGDYVYLDRGAMHGLEVGSELEVYEGGGIRREPVQRTRVETPPMPVAKLVVVSVRPDCSVAMIASSTTEIERGADVRAAGRPVASLH